MYLKQRFEKNSNSFNKSCPFCNSVINTKSYIKKHIRNFFCAINPTNSIKYASIYEKVQKECNKRQHGHSDDVYYHNLIDLFHGIIAKIQMQENNSI